MRRWIALLILPTLSLAACGSGDDEAAPTETTSASVATTVVVTTTAAPATSSTRATTSSTPAPATSTSKASVAATAVIEAHLIAGIPMGANKTQAIAVLGPPTKMGRLTDLGGGKYDYLTWELDGARGVSLSFNAESVTSPLLTDWKATTAGPRTKGGVQVGDSAAKVTAAHGALAPFCCESKVATVTEGGGRMIVIVGNGSQKVDQIVGGDPAFWSRKIAD